MKGAIEKLQEMGFARLPIGAFYIDAVLRFPTTPETGSSGSQDTGPKLSSGRNPHDSNLEAREQCLKSQELAFQSEYRLFQQQKSSFEFEHRRLIHSTQQQALEAISLKERIQDLLQEQQSSFLDLSSASQSLHLPSATAVYEADLRALQEQIAGMDLAGSEGIAVKKAVDKAEEMARNEEDSRKIRLQVTIARNQIVQFKGNLLVKDAEKMARNVNLSMQALGSDLLFQRSKNRIKEQLLKKMRSAAVSPRSNVRTDPQSPSQYWELPSNMSSPMRNSRESDRKRLNLETSERLKVQELNQRTSQLSEQIAHLQERLGKYEALEKDLVEKRMKAKSGIRRCIALQSALSKQETALSAREIRICEREDGLRAALARTLTPSESQEFLSISAQTLFKQQQQMMQDWTRVDIAKAQLEAEKGKIQEEKERLGREKDRVGRKWGRLELQREQLVAVRKKLEALLPALP